MDSGIAKVAELIKDMRMAMLVSVGANGFPHSRPMATQPVPFDGSVWFFTAHDSGKVDDVTRQPRVNVAYASSSNESFLSLSGTAHVLNDRARIHELWTPLLRAWFEGPDDPKVRLLRVDVEEAEYWDTPGGKVASLLSMVKAAITGDHDKDMADHGSVRLPVTSRPG
jgi:general stress protein 26